MRLNAFLLGTCITVVGAGTGRAQARLELVGGPGPGTSPTAVVVHGINPVDGDLDPLANELAARGFRTHLFHYGSAERLEDSARLLGTALRAVAEDARGHRVVVIGHSMGGLIARRAMTTSHSARLGELHTRFDLVTIASPLGGFRSANWSWLGMGFAPDSYRDLATKSPFIREPGDLADNVRHVKVETLETGARRLDGDRWLDDDVVGLDNQIHELVDRQADHIHRIAAGHTEIVNTQGDVHPRLIEILDDLLPVNLAYFPLPFPESVISTSSYG